MKLKYFLSVLFVFFTLCLPSYFSVAQPPPPKVAEAAMNNGLLALRDSNWPKAEEAFDLVLMLNPSYAPAYIGNFCAQLQVTEEKRLVDFVFGDIPVGIDEHPLYKRALERADAAYKKQLQEYAEVINKRVEEIEENGFEEKNEVEKESRKARDRMTLTINGADYAFRWCPAGTFNLGSPKDEPGRMGDEILHQVKLSKGFWMLETEVTQTMWASVMGNNPSRFKGRNLPVESVTWDECQEYITRLNELKIAPAGFKFALPTEAQWEYACRAGTQTVYSFGNILTETRANIQSDQTKEVGRYPANAWGLHDMHGNVYEWCRDLYHISSNTSEVVIDPIGSLSKRNTRVLRGGSFHDDVRLCRSAARVTASRDDRLTRSGMRVSLVPIK